MKDQQVDQVWQMLNREVLAKIAHKGPSVVFATISGAHLYGFASPDSDVDLRGAFLLPTREMLGLKAPAETLSIEDKTELDLDWVAHDLRKFARLMTNHNGYVLEQLYSPLVVVTTPEHEELKELGRGCVTRPCVRHYQGFAKGRIKRLLEPNPSVKHMLYAYRVLLTGIHLMQTGRVCSNIQTLNEIFEIALIDELVERKREGAEKMLLTEGDWEVNEPVLIECLERLDEAYDKSVLPDEPTTVSDLEDFVVRARLAADGLGS